jgi:hypothetical protein
LANNTVGQNTKKTFLSRISKSAIIIALSLGAPTVAFILFWMCMKCCSDKVDDARKNDTDADASRKPRVPLAISETQEDVSICDDDDDDDNGSYTFTDGRPPQTYETSEF